MYKRQIRNPRLREALATLRSVKRAEAALDQWKYPELGAHPVEKDQRKIPYVCLMDDSENETERRKAHPMCWMGREIPNDEIDQAKMLLSLFTYLIPAFHLGDMKGDAKHFDKAGNLKIEPEELVSEPEKESKDPEEEIDVEETESVVPLDNQPETETNEPLGTVVLGTNVQNSDSDIEIIEVLPKKPKKPIVVGLDEMASEEGAEKIKVEPKSEPAKEPEPTPSTSTAGFQIRSVDNLAAIQEQIQHLTRLVNEHVIKNTNSTAKNPKQGQTQGIRPPKLEPENAEKPEESGSANDDTDQEDDTDKFIQSMENHLAATHPVEQTPRPPSSESQEKEPRDFANIVGKELLAQLETAVKASLDRCDDAKDDQDLTSAGDESETPGSEETENQGIEEVGSSSSSSQGEVTVNPTNINSPVKQATPRPGPQAGYLSLIHI